MNGLAEVSRELRQPLQELTRRVPMIGPARPKGEAAADRAPGSDVAVVGVGRGLESASRLPVVVRDCAGAGYFLL